MAEVEDLTKRVYALEQRCAKLEEVVPNVLRAIGALFVNQGAFAAFLEESAAGERKIQIAMPGDMPTGPH